MAQIGTAVDSSITMLHSSEAKSHVTQHLSQLSISLPHQWSLQNLQVCLNKTYIEAEWQNTLSTLSIAKCPNYKLQSYSKAA